MKKQLLTLIAILFIGTIHLQAQCVIGSSTVPGIIPDSATGLPHGLVGVPYSTDMQFRIPHDSIIPLCGFTLVNYFAVNSIGGLPTGFTWVANPANDTFPGSTNGCVRIQGPALASVGTYPLTVQLQADGTSGICGHISLPYSITYYKIVIDSATGIAPVIGSSFELFQNVPNPFEASTNTEINFTLPTAGKVDFHVYDLLGKEIISKTIDAVPGINRNYLSSKYLKAGIYFYSVTYRGKTITRKMIVTARP